MMMMSYVRRIFNFCFRIRNTKRTKRNQKTKTRKKKGKEIKVKLQM